MQPAFTWTPVVEDARWSVKITDMGTDRTLLENDPARLLRTASLGKVFALRGAADHLTRDPSVAAIRLARPTDHLVADSGLWQYLDQADLSVGDVANLVSSCSDNLAANALISWLGLDHLSRVADAWAPGGSRLHDYFRDERGPDLPETVSQGCAGDYVGIMVDLHRSSDPALHLMLTWLERSVDLSLVGAATYLDPLSHPADARVRFVNKTGSDTCGVRADTGVMVVEGRAVAYAAIANWQGGTEPGRTEAVVEDFRRLGAAIREYLG